MSLIPPSFQELALPGLREAVVLITGATRGSGLMMAHLFAQCGARVAINSRSLSETTQLAEELHERYRVPILALPASVSDAKAVDAMFEKLSEWSAQRLEVLICNAGHPLVHEMWHTPLHEMKQEQVTQWFEQIRAVDLDGARFCSRQALRMMISQRRGSIVFISSTPALSGYRGTPYTEAKAALLGLMHDLAREYGQYNIRVNAVALGNIASGWYENLTEEQRKALAHEAPLARWGKAEEVAGAILFLASDLSGFITGQTLVVDGGKV
ncbi:SDR family oxidoreductase, partial [candidate division KSB1 bacterium]|nr:SDR family oxidoreductase [candidate division KSB1 bacterium]